MLYLKYDLLIHISKYSVVIVVYFYKNGTWKYEDCKIFWSDNKKLSSKHVKFASYVNQYYKFS
jgi:hypothetical protein